MARRRGRPPKQTYNAPKSTFIDPKDSRWKYGNLHLLDSFEDPGDPQLAAAINNYAYYIEANRQARQWVRAVQWIENILFLAGRHYIDDILVSRLARDSDGNTSVVKEALQNIPRPVNDVLGRYVETNIALLTENRPIPRVTAKSDRSEDQAAAELAELTLEYLWEKLRQPEKKRDIARLLLLTGVCWNEVCWDPTQPRLMAVPATEQEQQMVSPEGAPPIQIPLEREVTKFGPGGVPVYEPKIVYGDIVSNVISAFNMHLPTSHDWNDDRMGWIMKENYTSIEMFQDRYGHSELAKELTRDKGWFLERLEDIGTYNIQNLPLWWWERLSDLVEGPGPSLYVGTPEAWDNHTVVRVLDRKPSPRWPKGRTVIVAGNQVIYDSPKEIGARAYDPRWPDRWHPYIRYRWEPMPGSIYGRSLVSKLLPKLKRVNAIDTSMIMWRRTVPISAWVVPKGAHPVDDVWSGRPGLIWEWDPRRSANARPEPVFPPPFPEAALREREQQLAEMEAIAGTEEILRGQRPTGVTSAAMIELLRRQALASRSAILQSWDESLQEDGVAQLQEVMKHVDDDPIYAERLRILAREKHSRLTINSFKGTDISDNVVLRVDTASMALTSKEAREAKALEVMQYAPGLMALPLQLRQALVEELGFKKSLTPQGPDVERAKRMLTWIRTGQLDRLIPYPEDDPYIFLEIFTEEMKSDSFDDLGDEQKLALLKLVEIYKQAVQKLEEARIQMMMATGGVPGGGPAGGA
jgi:hypothetical protein